MSTDLLPYGTTPKKRGLPLWSALVALLILAMVAVAGLGAILYLTLSDKAKVQRQVQELEARQARAELARKKLAEEARLTAAHNRQQELLTQTRAATNALFQLLADVNRFKTEAASLKSDEAGRVIALHPDLVAQARRFFESDLRELPQNEETISKLESIRRIEQQLISAQGTAFEPGQDLTLPVQNALFWSEQSLSKCRHAQTLLTALIQDAKIKITPLTVTADSPSLEKAILRLVQAESALTQQIIVEKTSEAKTQAASTVAEAEAERIVKEAQLKAAEILREANEKTAQQQRGSQLIQAQNQLEDTKTEVAAQKIEKDARQLQLLEKAKDPNVQAKLAPFISQGYWQINATSYDKKPLSYSRLQSFSALTPTPKGLEKLWQIGTSKSDALRPRWHLRGGILDWYKHPATYETVKEAQQLLIELGPALVELGLLQP